MGNCCSCEGPVVTYHSPRLKGNNDKRMITTPTRLPSEQPLFVTGTSRRPAERGDDPSPTMEDSRRMEDFDDVTTPPAIATTSWSTPVPRAAEVGLRKPLPVSRAHERCETFAFPTTATDPSPTRVEDDEGRAADESGHAAPTHVARQGSLSSWQVPAQHFQFMGQGHGGGSANNSLRRVSSTNQKVPSGVFSLHSASSSGSGTRKQIGAASHDHSVVSSGSAPQSGALPTATFGADGDVPLPSVSCVRQAMQAGDAFNPLIGCGSDSTSCVAHAHHTGGFIFSPQSSSSRQQQGGVPSNVFDILCPSADVSKTTQHYNHDFGFGLEDGVSPMHTALKRDSVLSEESGEGGTRWRQPTQLPGAVDTTTTATSSSSTRHYLLSRGFEGGEVPPTKALRRSSGNNTEGGSSSCTQPSQGSVSAMRLALTFDAMGTTRPVASNSALAGNNNCQDVSKGACQPKYEIGASNTSMPDDEHIMQKYQTQHSVAADSGSVTEPYDGVSSVATLRKSTASDEKGDEVRQAEGHRSLTANANSVGQLASLVSFPPESGSPANEEELSPRRLSQVPYGAFPTVITTTTTTSVSVSDIGSYSTTRRRSIADSLNVASPVAPTSNGATTTTATTTKSGHVFVVEKGAECETFNPIDEQPLPPAAGNPVALAIDKIHCCGETTMSPEHRDLETHQADESQRSSFEVVDVCGTHTTTQAAPEVPLLIAAIVGSPDESVESPQVDDNGLVMQSLSANAGTAALRSALSDPFSLHSQHGSPSAASCFTAVTRPVGASPSCTGEGFLHAAILPTDCLSSAAFPFLAVASSQSHQQPNAKRLSATTAAGSTNNVLQQVSLTTPAIAGECNPLSVQMLNPRTNCDAMDDEEEGEQDHNVREPTECPDEAHKRLQLLQFSNAKGLDSEENDGVYGGLPAAPRNSSASVLCRSTASSSCGLVAGESKSPHLSRSAHMSQSSRNEQSFSDCRRQLSAGGGNSTSGRAGGGRSRDSSSVSHHRHNSQEHADIFEA